MSRTFTLSDNRYLNSLTTPVTAAPFTIACWFYFTGSTGNDNCLVQIQDDGVAAHNFRIGKTTAEAIQMRVAAGTGTNESAITSTTITANTWQHACGVVHSTTDRRVFLDGGGKGTNTLDRTPANLDSIDIGNEGDSSPGDNWIGRIAEVVIWNVALSDAEVAQIATGIPQWRVRPADVVAYYPLFGNADPEVDLSGNGNNLTLFNTPGVASHPPVSLPFGFDVGRGGAGVPSGPAYEQVAFRFRLDDGVLTEPPVA